ncbi:MAG TPA: DUF5916 domain-containing protein [Thermoanaerobaculia bacterium]
MRRLLVFLVFFGVSARVSAIEIARLQGAVTIDGDVSEAAWQSARGVDSYVEYFRSDNTTPPAKTRSFVAYDDGAIYVAWIADDPNPSAIRAPLVDRDNVRGDQDYVAILLDTANRKTSGINFRVNPRGVQTDSLLNEATGEEDFSPDFFYEAVARQTATGWSAEMRIPLASLRYPSTDPQTWGVILLRNYPRDFRYIMANITIPKNSGCFLCHAAELTGLTGLPSGSHMTMTPYSTASVRRDYATGAGAGGRELPIANQFDNDLGFDMKWNPSTRLTIDATLNPDFSQVEADVPQMAVGERFALAFPEKRTFFLESVDLLKTPLQAVYTRTINAPAWGMRATGDVAGSAYTFLVTEDRGGGSVILPSAEGSDFIPGEFRSRIALGRIRRTFGKSFGAFLVSTREVEGGGHNRVFGPDFVWRLNSRDRVIGQFLASSTKNPVRTDLHESFDGREADGLAYRTVYRRDEKRYDIWTLASAISPGFRADNGFVPQTGLRRYALWTGVRTYPSNFLSFFRAYSGTEYDGGYDNNEVLRRGVYQGFEFEGKWGSSGWVTAQYEDERVGSELLHRNYVTFELAAAPKRWLPAIQFDGSAGQKLDYAGAQVGNGATLNLSSTLRATDHLELQLKTSREWLDVDGTRLFDAKIDWLKFTYTFSARSLVRMVGMQKEITRRDADRNRSLSLSGLYSWKLNWQTVFFVGYGDSSITGETGALIPDTRSVFMKVAYAFQR